MRFFRSVAYSIVAICLSLCLIILFYRGKAKNEDNQIVSTENASVGPFVEVKGNEVSADEVKDAANAIINDVANSVIDAFDNITEKIPEISYSEVVKLQDEALDGEFRQALEDYYKENGISISKPSASSTSSSVQPEMHYVVNKNTKVIHRIGCLLEPSGTYAVYFENLTKASDAGYKDKCVVCNP